MKVGFALPHQGPVATRDNMRLVATEAELMGYDSLWTNERLLVPVNANWGFHLGGVRSWGGHSDRRPPLPEVGGRVPGVVRHRR